MKPIILESKENAIEAVNGLQRGANYLQILDNEEIVLFLRNRIDVYNEHFGGKRLMFKKFQDEFELEFNGFTINDGIYLIASSIENSDIPVLKKHSYIIQDLAHQAKITESVININIDDSLHKYAKHLAYVNDIFFRSNTHGTVFSGVNKGVSISQQIDLAYKRGDHSISFNLKDVSIVTLRCYASNLSAMCGEKIRCSSLSGVGTIYFKEESVKERVADKIKKNLLELDFDNDRIALLDELKSFYE
jgi:hypothetical protein